jgi:hypothetical protein
MGTVPAGWDADGMPCAVAKTLLAVSYPLRMAAHLAAPTRRR